MKARYRVSWTAAAVVLLLTSGALGASSEMDGRIEASAKSSYVFQTYLKGDDIRIESMGGVVVLAGTVAEELHKSLAQETVASLPGVKSVDNRLELRSGGPSEDSDAQISGKVKAALLFRRNVDASQIEVFVKDGIVILRGDAGSQAQKDLATEYAKAVEGAKAVKNEMTVSGTRKNVYEATMRGKIDDASITAQIRMALLIHQSTSVLSTRVDTNDGVVTLHGKASNAAEKELVTKLVADIKGVKTVKNEMTIGESK
ncbi:MAG: BON domain-containing protein [Deltaproteobacteria bacterium]|nr:BON domain-containing protein [Deltaproteobacteria bacterium]